MKTGGSHQSKNNHSYAEYGRYNIKFMHLIFFLIHIESPFAPLWGSRLGPAGDFVSITNAPKTLVKDPGKGGIM